MQTASLADRIAAAHRKTGAPGTVIGYYADGRYRVQLQYGQRLFRFRTHGAGDLRITVVCNWSIAGCRQRKQATV